MAHDPGSHAHDHTPAPESPAKGPQPDNPHGHGTWTHDHVFLGAGQARAESRARLAALITAAFMVVEIGCGFYFNSMALLADGVHMGTHVGALGLAAAAYWLARRHAGDARFSFGSGKFGDLAAFASAILLGVTALLVAIESITRLISPTDVRYGEALLVAVIGLAVNLVCALILKDAHSHDHGGDQGHAHKHDGDNNMRAAYVHVLADAATSVLAIAALAGGYFGGWGFLDPLAALVGAGVIGAWAYGLTRDSAMVLLDADADPQLSQDIRQLLSGEMGARVADLHLWRLGPGHRGLIVSLVAPGPVSAETIKTVLRARHPDLSHVTVEVAICADCT